ncbi:MAG: phosphonate ABC transporter ATP-binding protein [Anaerolineaceae bacterium]|nr:phosphonate ABC transporter ATP-binding protein [Anaerolineaceae bacterium]
MLEIRHLTKIYDDGTVALKDVSFTVPDGEFLVVIGLSGSGKSTLLRCINRLIDPTEGEIIWNGVDLAQISGVDLRKTRRHIGMIFQHFNLVERSTVMTNIMSGRLGYAPTFASVFRRFSNSDMEMAQAALDRLGIADQAHKLARELSGGQQQRVGIARALMQEPDLILADEPVASLDPVLAHSIMLYLERLNQEDHMTIICSLHYLDLVQRYSTSVLGLRDGEVAYEGSKQDIINMTDEEFKDIYGEEAERVGGGLEGSLNEEVAA